jgi:MGT family glycosyltransferase
MKPGIREVWRTITGMGRINKKMQLLRSHGYELDTFVSIIQNDNETDTIVYTTKEFQPKAETFSDRYSFVGPSIPQSLEVTEEDKNKKLIYISLGTILNQNKDFYQNCIKAFGNSGYDVIMSVGEKTEIEYIPDNFTVEKKVDQISVLQKADVFITHCGMNSVNESLYAGVPMVLFPLHSEQRVVANRAAELGTGIKLKGNNPKHLAKAVADVLADPTYLENVKKLSKNFRNAGGAVEAANVIEAKLTS